MAKSEPALLPTATNPLRPSSLVIVDTDDRKRVLNADVYDDLVWLYMHFTAEKHKYKEVYLVYCTGQKLKPQLVVGLRLVGDTLKENIHYENPLAQQLHERQYTET